MAYNNKMPNDENKSLNSNHSSYSYDEVFPALRADVKPKNQTGSEHMQPAAPFPNQIRNMRSEITTVG